MNGASEATLQELLAVNQQMAASLTRLAGGGAGGAGAGGAGGGAAGSANVLGKSFNALGVGIGAVSGILTSGLKPALMAAKFGFDKLVQTGSALIDNQMQLAEGYIHGTNALSDMTKGLENLPFGLGLVAKAMTYQTRILEANIQTYQELSTVGARFGANLDEVRKSAAGVGLSLDEFSRVMKDAAPQLRFMGGSAEEGAKNMVAFNKQFVMGKDGLGKGLLGMGFTLEEANGMIAAYSTAIGGLKADQLKDQREMEKSVKFFAEELDAAAQLEGKTRKQKEDEMKEASQQAAIRAKLAEMGPEEQKKYLAAYNAALRIGGKGAAEALQSQLLGLPPMTKAAQQFTAVNGQAAQTVAELGKTVEDGTSAADARAKMDRLAAKGQKESADMYKGLGATGKALSFANKDFAETVNAGAKNYADGLNMGLKTEEDWANRTDKVRSQQEAAQKSNIGSIVQAQGAAKHFGGMMDMLTKLLEPLFPVINWLIDGFTTLVPKIVDFASDIIDNVIKPVFNNLFGDLTMDQFIKPFKDFWDGLFSGSEGIDYKAIVAGITDFFKPMVEMFRNVMSTFDFRALGKGLGDSLGNLFTTGKEILTPVIQKASEIFGQVASDFAPVMQDLFEITNSIIDIIRTVLWPVVKPVVMGFMDAMLPLWNAFKSIIKFINELLKGNFSNAGKMLFDAIGGLWDALKAMVGGIFDGIKSLASMGWDAIKSFFGFGGEKKATPEPAKPTAAPAQPQTPASSAAPSAPTSAPSSTPEGRAKELGTPPAKTEAGQQASSGPYAVQPASKNPQDILVAELQTLNKITTEMLRSLRDTADYTKSTANLIASNGNLFRRA